MRKELEQISNSKKIFFRISLTSTLIAKMFEVPEALIPTVLMKTKRQTHTEGYSVQVLHLIR